MKKLVSFLTAIAMLIPSASALAQNTDDLLFEVDFSKGTPGRTVKGLTRYNVPVYGDIRYEVPEGKDSVYLCIDDTEDSTSSYGPKFIYDFSTVRTNCTIQTSFLVSENAFKLDFMPKGSSTSYSEGVRFYYKSTKQLSLDNTSSDSVNYITNLGATLKLYEGEKIDMWIYMDYVHGVADVYMTSKNIAHYNGELDARAEKCGDYICMKDIPVNCSSIGRFMLTSQGYAGKIYLEYVRVYDGNALPDTDVVAADNVPEETILKRILPYKAPWISREETVKRYENKIASDVKTLSVLSEEVETPEKPDYSRYMPDPAVVQANLEKYAGVHPRVPYDQADWDAFHERMKIPEQAEKFQKLLETTTYLETEVGLNTKPGISIEAKYRTIGRHMAFLAFVYKATGEEKYIDRAIEWAEFGCTLGQIGKDNLSLAIGQFMHGFGLVYDYGYDKIPDDLKAKMRQKILVQGRILHDHMVNLVYDGTWPGTNYLGNFGMVINMGLMYAAYAIYDEEPEVLEWLPESMKYAAMRYALSSDDGYSLEGTNYWSFGYSFLMEEAELSRKMWGIDPFELCPWMKNVAYYRFYLAYPVNSWTKTQHVMMCGDNAAESDVACIDYIFYMLADRYDMPFMQWLGDEMQKRIPRTSASGQAYWIPYYYNAEVEAKSPAELNMPTLHYFDDYDVVSARSDWSGDESMILFKCGSNLGKKASSYIPAFAENPSLGEAHSHPDANHFNLFGAGDLLLRDDGYVYKQTNSHNTLLINGAGQEFEGKSYYNAGAQRQYGVEYYSEIPYIKTVVSTDDYDYFVGCGANAYPEARGLLKYDRHMFYLKKEDVLLVVDDIETEEEADLELRFFPQHETVSEMDGVFVAQGPKNTLFMENLTPEEGTMAISDCTVYYKQLTTDQREAKAFTVKKHGAQMLNATAISWSEAEGAPKRVSMTKDGDTFNFHTGSNVYSLNPVSCEASCAEAEPEKSEPELSGVIIGNIPLAFEEGRYRYAFNLDDYYLLADTNTLGITPVIAQGGSNITVEKMPPVLPGKVQFLVDSDGTTRLYTVEVQRTAFDVKKIPLTTTAAKSVDNDLRTFFEPSSTNRTVDYDMGALKQVCGIEIAWENSIAGCANYRIEYSKDGETFAPFYEGRSSGRSVTREYVPFETPFEARYIRLCLDKNDDYDFYHGVVEFAAFESN